MTMIFVNKKETASVLQDKLRTQGIQSKILIGGMDNKDRDQIIDQFRLNAFTTLISTNVLARGIDVPEVDIVINFDVPIIKKFGWTEPDYANFMHRVGRTGRFGTDGIAVSLIADEVEQEMIRKIGEHYDIDIRQLSDFNQLVAALNEMRNKV